MASKTAVRLVSSSALTVISRTTFCEVSVKSTILPVLPPASAMAVSSLASTPFFCELRTRTMRMILRSQAIQASFLFHVHFNSNDDKLRFAPGMGTIEPCPPHFPSYAPAVNAGLKDKTKDQRKGADLS